MNHIWIVEMGINKGVINNQLILKWEPTVGAALTRRDGLEKLKDWKLRNPCDPFRLTKYTNQQQG